MGMRRKHANERTIATRTPASDTHAQRATRTAQTRDDPFPAVSEKTEEMRAQAKNSQAREHAARNLPVVLPHDAILDTRVYREKATRFHSLRPHRERGFSVQCRDRTRNAIARSGEHACRSPIATKRGIPRIATDVGTESTRIHFSAQRRRRIVPNKPHDRTPSADRHNDRCEERTTRKARERRHRQPTGRPHAYADQRCTDLINRRSGPHAHARREKSAHRGIDAQRVTILFNRRGAAQRAKPETG